MTQSTTHTPGSVVGKYVLLADGVTWAPIHKRKRKVKISKAVVAVIAAVVAVALLVVSAGYAWAASRQTSPPSAAAPAPSTTSTVPTTPAPGIAGIKPPEAPTPSTVTRTETQTVTPPATPTDPKYLSSGYQCPLTPSTWSYDPTNQQLTLRTQWALRDLGYTLPANGVYDAATRDAVTRFQRNHGLVADGAAGSQTWACIDAANAINQGRAD